MLLIPCDLAATKDFTAVGVVRAVPAVPRSYFVGHLDRWREPYSATVKRVTALATLPQMRAAALVVDSTGVGSPVLEQLRAALPGRVVYGVHFTSGSKPTRGAGPHDLRAPKRDLVSALQVVLQTRRLTYARALPLARTLQDELAAFQETRTESLNLTYEGAGPHDDLVMCLALAAWVGEHLPAPVGDVSQWVLNDRGDDDEPDERSRVERIADELGLFQE